MRTGRNRQPLTFKLCLANDLSNTIYAYAPYTGEREAISDSLMAYSEELLRELTDSCGAESDLTSHLKIGISKQYSEETIREMITFLPAIPYYSHEFTMNLLTSLQSYRQLPETNHFSSMGQEVISQCTALLRATAEFDAVGLFRDGDRPSSGFADDMLVDFIIAHASDIDRIIDIVRERGTADPILLSEVLDADATAIAKGVL